MEKELEIEKLEANVLYTCTHVQLLLHSNKIFIILDSHENIYWLNEFEKDDIAHRMLRQFVHIKLDGHHSNAWHLHDGAVKYETTIGGWNTS